MKRLSVLFLIVLTLAGLLFLGCGKEKQKKTEKVEERPSITAGRKEKEVERLPVPEYTVLDEDIYDAPIKTQVTLKLLVSGKITKQGLTNLLEEIYSKTRVRSGFKYHSRPTLVFIYAYTSKEYAQSGSQWIAMLKGTDEGKEPEISTNKAQLAQLRAKPEEKFGLSEAKRKLIYAEIAEAIYKADREVIQKYPLPKLGEPGYSQAFVDSQLEKQDKQRDILTEKYEKEVAKKHGLTGEQLDGIYIEGVSKDWPKRK